MHHGMVLRFQNCTSSLTTVEKIIQWTLTPGNTDDREPLKDKDFTRDCSGRLFADRGYISQELFETLFVDDIHLVTKLKKNMKNSLMNLHDKILLRKRALVETVNDELKNLCQIEHTKAQVHTTSPQTWLQDSFRTAFCQKKPSLNSDIIDKRHLSMAAALLSFPIKIFACNSHIQIHLICFFITSCKIC